MSICGPIVQVVTWSGQDTEVSETSLPLSTYIDDDDGKTVLKVFSNDNKWIGVHTITITGYISSLPIEFRDLNFNNQYEIKLEIKDPCDGAQVSFINLSPKKYYSYGTEEEPSLIIDFTSNPWIVEPAFCGITFKCESPML